MAKYKVNDRVRVKDPANRSKRCNGSVTTIGGTRNQPTYTVQLDDGRSVTVSVDEITGKST